MKFQTIFLLALVTISVVHSETTTGTGTQTEIDDAFENIKIDQTLLDKLEHNLEGAKPEEGVQWNYLEFAKNTDKKAVHLEEQVVSGVNYELIYEHPVSFGAKRFECVMIYLNIRRIYQVTAHGFGTSLDDANKVCKFD